MDNAVNIYHKTDISVQTRCKILYKQTPVITPVTAMNKLFQTVKFVVNFDLLGQQSLAERWKERMEEKDKTKRKKERKETSGNE